jgi:hypothetical protein
MMLTKQQTFETLLVIVVLMGEPRRPIIFEQLNSLLRPVIG